MEITEDEEEGNAFLIKDLWRPSKLTSEVGNTAYQELEGLARQRSNTESLSFFDNLKLDLPDLDHFRYGLLETTSFTESISASLEDDGPPWSEVDEEDVWAFADNIHDGPEEPVLRTWEFFNDRAFREPITYLSEAGPFTFDAALLMDNHVGEAESDTITGQIVIRVDPLLSALLQLGLGRASSMFEYRTEEKTFVYRFPNVRLTGYSMEACQSVITKFVGYGNQMRVLQSFAERSYNVRAACSTLIATAATVSSVLTVVEAKLTDGMARVHSLLELQALFDRPSRILDSLGKLTQSFHKTLCDEEILSRVFAFVQNIEWSCDWLRPFVLSLLGQISAPWLKSASAAVGLPATGMAGYNSFRNLQLSGKNEVLRSNESAAHSVMPDFVEQKDRDQFAQISQGLHILRKYKEDHVLVRSLKLNHMTSPKLEWHFSWVDIERIQAKAAAYEANMMKVMTEKFSDGNEDVLSEQGLGVTDDNAMSQFEDSFNPFVQNSYAIFERPLSAIVETCQSDPLRHAVEQALSGTACNFNGHEELDPPISLSSTLSLGPTLSAQSRLVNLACLQLLFRDHKIRSHLSLQRRYHFFGDGVFASRFSHALFDPDLHSAERRKGYTRSGVMGLKLGSRETWPPASSELRLALMGILTESFYGSIENDVPRILGQELPGGLSFAIRDLSEEEIQKCLNPNSIEALDFLRLSYTAPPPLDAIITSSSLDKYDAIFKLLLRMTRMLFVVNQLFRAGRSRSSHRSNRGSNALRFRIEAHHFISSVSIYFSETGIGAVWARFEDDVASMEKRVGGCDAGGQLSQFDTLEQLCIRHEQALDSIRLALLLRKRQEPALRLLEEISSLILQYAKFMSSGGLEDLESVDQVNTLYRDFRAKAKEFISTCASMAVQAQQRGQSKGSEMEDDGSSSISRLLLKLDMNQYYSRAF